jgi:hypothetical protein
MDLEKAYRLLGIQDTSIFDDALLAQFVVCVCAFFCDGRLISDK